MAPAPSVSETRCGTPRKATAVQLIFMTYAVICSGAYGLEQMVSASGPGLALALLVVLPFLYAAPMALTCSELTSRYPVEGGYYRWVRMAFGDFVGFSVAWLVWLTMFVTNASFAVLFSNYLTYFVPSLSGHAHFLAAAALVWVAVLLNYRGIGLVGTASVIFTLLIFVPFAIMSVLALIHWQHNPVVPFVNPQQSFSSALFNGVLIAMWLYGGFERMTVNAQEIENPVRAFPRALGIGLLLCSLSYIIPTFLALAANGDWHKWGESYFMVAAGRIGGPWLGGLMAAGGLISNCSLVVATTLSQSRLPMVLAEDGLFPRAFQRTHPRFGTPVMSLIVTGILLTALCSLDFTELVSIYALVQSLAYLLIYAAFIKLRTAPSPMTGSVPGFRIPLRTPGLLALVSPSFFIAALVIHKGIIHYGSFPARQTVIGIVICVSGSFAYAIRRWRRNGVRPQLGTSAG